MSRASSIWAGVTISGGVSVSTLPIVVLNDRPRDSGAVEHTLGDGAGRGLALAVLHQLQPEQQTAAAHVADQRVAPLHLVQPRQRLRADPGRVVDQAFALDHLERGQRGRGGDRVLLVRVVPVGLLSDDVQIVPCQAGSDRQYAAAQGLAEHHDVGYRAVVISGEESPGLAQSGGDLVEDQQRAMRRAGLAHGLPVARRRQVGHGTRRLGDHRGDVALALQHVAHHRGAGQPALFELRPAVGVHQVTVGAAIAAKRRDMFTAGQQRTDPPGAEQALAADAAGAEARAVEGVPEAQGLETTGGRAGQLDRHLDGIAAAGGEEHPAGRTGQRLEAGRQGLGQFDGPLAGKTARCKAQRIELRLDRADHVRVGVAHVVHVVAVEVHVAAAGTVFDEHALGLADGRQAGRRQRLVQEHRAVARQQGARRRRRGGLAASACVRACG
jgi:hypothetical protein